MKSTVSEYDFIQAFLDVRPNNFSHEGLRALFEYLEEYEDSTDVEIELDVIELCSDFTEYENIAEFNDNYGIDAETIEDIEYHTVVIPIDDESFIISDF